MTHFHSNPFFEQQNSFNKASHYIPRLRFTIEVISISLIGYLSKRAETEHIFSAVAMVLLGLLDEVSLYYEHHESFLSPSTTSIPLKRY